jgi:hypothetical protein
MEDRQQQKQITGKLLRNLGYDRDALDGQDVMLTGRVANNIYNAIKSLPIDHDNKRNMINFAKNHEKNDGSIMGLSLKALAAKINTNDMETQDKTDSYPAVLPQSNQPAPKPVNKQQMLQQQMAQQNQPPLAAGFQ